MPLWGPLHWTKNYLIIIEFCKSLTKHTGGSKGGARDASPPPRPPGPNSFNFIRFLGKFGKIVCWRLLWGVGAPSSGKSWIRHCIELAPPPPNGNPWSVLANVYTLMSDVNVIQQKLLEITVVLVSGFGDLFAGYGYQFLLCTTNFCYVPIFL